MTQMPPPVPEGRSGEPVGYAAPVPARSAGLAIAAFVLSLLSIIPILGVPLGLTGAILGIVSLARSKAGRVLAIASIAIGMFGMCFMQSKIIDWIPTVTDRFDSRRPICGANLNGIARGIALYRADYADTTPADLNAIVAGGYIGGKQLVCPSDTGSGPSYFYLPKPKSAPADCIVACDLKTNHFGHGRNVLYNDGTVRWLKKRAFKTELADPINADFAAALRLVEGP